MTKEMNEKIYEILNAVNLKDADITDVRKTYATIKGSSGNFNIIIEVSEINDSPNRRDYNEDDVLRMYYNLGYTQKLISESIGISKYEVSRIIKASKETDTDTPSESYNRNAKRNKEIIDMYQNSHYTQAEIGAKFGISRFSVCRILRGAGICKNKVKEKG